MENLEGDGSILTSFFFSDGLNQHHHKVIRLHADAPALETCQDIICIGDGLSLAGCEKARSFHDDDRNLQKGCLYN